MGTPHNSFKHFFKNAIAFARATAARFLSILVSMKPAGQFQEDHHATKRWKVIAILSTTVVSFVLALLAIYGASNYGIAIFVVVPIIIGAMPTLVYARKHIPSRRLSLSMSLIVLSIVFGSLLVFAIDGLICLLMTAPLAFAIVFAVTAITHGMLAKRPRRAAVSLWVVLLSFPMTLYWEHDQQSTVHVVTTSVVVEADIQTVWDNVVDFPTIQSPREFLFKAGIAYPINATIEGHGVGAVRFCNFSTGSFVEPITQWQEPHLLAFDVEQNPPPMKELSFWDIDAPHLHDYFVSKRGEFQLTSLGPRETKVDGTTWYTHDVYPAVYWQFWSEYLIHKIHRRVLNHIKAVAEQKNHT